MICLIQIGIIFVFPFSDELQKMLKVVLVSM